MAVVQDAVYDRSSGSLPKIILPSTAPPPLLSASFYGSDRLFADADVDVDVDAAAADADADAPNDDAASFVV